MLRNTFQHISGYGFTKEANLWESGVFTWDELLNRKRLQLSFFENHEHKKILDDSYKALEKRDSDFFAKHLANSEHYRIALTFPEDVLFLDIETTGLSRYYDHITVVGWSNQRDFEVYYQGLDPKRLINAIERSKCIVTFNGSIFDLPFIKKEFPSVKLPVSHIDLRFFAKRFGLTGGLKIIEGKIGFERPQNMIEISGEAAPILWHKYKNGDLESLEKLISYNHQDVESLKVLLDTCIEMRLSQFKSIRSKLTPFRFSESKSEPNFSKNYKDGTILLNLYEGRVGPAVTLSDLPQPIPQNLKFIGIDLTGSPKKASGWASIQNGQVETALLHSDEEIVDLSLKFQPKLISIDSPLSLPFGRTSVFDSDEGRKEFGIMRQCERILKKRGVNVYPCLIPSMQNLTQRGMNLADAFRKRGIPVIESYPGAAQDILGIPRKQSSIEFLVKGLSQFGLNGDFATISKSHDELDAITSALVGYFFWFGKFEALGNEEEDYLIIPSLTSNESYWNKQRAIGISGALAAGKTTAGLHLASSSYSYSRFSLMVAKLLEEENKEPSRSNLQEKGNYINQTFGQRWLCKQLYKTFLLSKSKVVIDGLRFPEDHAFMVERFGPSYHHIHIFAKEEIRKERYNSLERNNIPFEEASLHIIEGKVSALAELSEHVILNEGSLKEFFKLLDKNT